MCSNSTFFSNELLHVNIYFEIMKNERITKSLGFTQDQLAMLLGVTRSRISLFELGLRPLPVAASYRLNEIMAIAASADTQIGKQPPFSKVKGETSIMFMDLLRENERKQQRVGKKIKALQGKHTEGLKGQALLDHLASHSDNQKESPFLFMPAKNRNAKYIIQNGQSQMIKYEIQLKVLKYEEQLLEEARGVSNY